MATINPVSGGEWFRDAHGNLTQVTAPTAPQAADGGVVPTQPAPQPAPSEEE